MTKNEMMTLLLKDGDKHKRKNDVPIDCIQTRAEGWNGSAPMIAQDMPDYAKFCANYPAKCWQCQEYISDDKSSLFCQLWERTFPGKVKWHEKT